MHPSGESVEWAAEGDPAKSTYAILKAAVTKIAVGSLLARHWPVRWEARRLVTLWGIFRASGMEVRPRLKNLCMSYRWRLVLAICRISKMAVRLPLDAANNHLAGNKGYGLPAMIETFGEARR